MESNNKIHGMKTLAGILLFSAAIVVSGSCFAAESETEEINGGVENNLVVEKTFVGDSLIIEEEPDITFEGVITDTDTEFTYSFVAPRDGTYWICPEDIKANCRVSLSIQDSLGNAVQSSYGNLFTMEADEEYRIFINKDRGNTGFTLRIKSQKPDYDLTGITHVEDQVVYEDEMTVYYFTAPIDGLYQFLITDKTKAASISAYMYAPYGGKYETRIADLGWGGFYENHGISVLLEEGETYLLHVKQYNGIGNYTMEIIYQKPTVDITGYTTVNDEMEHNGQKNYYSFTAPADGNYGFIVDGDREGYIELFRGEESLDSSYFESVDQVFGELKEGETYTVYIEQREFGDYHFDIVYPQSAFGFLKEFKAEESSSDDELPQSETEDSAEVAELREKNEQLESELEELQEKYDLLVQIIGDSGIDVDEE